MKHNAYFRRSSGRSGGRNRSRGNQGQNVARQRNYAKQQLDKYLSLARDTFMTGDRIVVEGYFQHAEHFQRLYNELSPSTMPSFDIDADSSDCSKVEESTSGSFSYTKNSDKIAKEILSIENGKDHDDKRTPKKNNQRYSVKPKLESGSSIVEISIEDQKDSN